jgi:threonine 3-dehydrogenase
MSRMMKAIVKKRPEPGAVVESVEVPRIDHHDVLIRVHATSICGTDLHIYNWDAWSQNRIRIPQILGHEFCGEVVEVGNAVQSIQVGDFVSAETHIVCHVCFQCRTGQAHVCQNCKIIGVDRDGSFAEYVSVPELAVWKNSPSLRSDLASIQEPLGNAVQATLVEDVAGKSVVVTGCGPTGLFAVAIAKACGATAVYAADVNDYRLRLARSMGATETYNPRTGGRSLGEWVLEANEGFGVDVALEMSGSPAAVQGAFQAVRNGGRVTLFGIPSRPIELDLAEGIIFKGITIHGVTGRRLFDTWYRTRWFLEAGILNIDPVITHRMKFEDIDEAMGLMAAGQCGKIVLTP